MKRKPHSTSLVLLLVCIFTFWWGVSVLAQRDSAQPSVAATPAAPAAATGTPLVINESLKGGTYTYSGTFNPPLCNSLGSGIRYSGAGGGHVSVLLVTEPTTTRCAQAAGGDTGEPFSVSIKIGSGGKPAFDGVLLNGSSIPAQLVEQL